MGRPCGQEVSIVVSIRSWVQRYRKNGPVGERGGGEERVRAMLGEYDGELKLKTKG